MFYPGKELQYMEHVAVGDVQVEFYSFMGERYYSAYLY
jgi:hypothetical protein